MTSEAGTDFSHKNCGITGAGIDDDRLPGRVVSQLRTWKLEALRAMLATASLSGGRISVAKGQLRSNREKKKPKQAKKAAASATPYTLAQANPGAAPGKKK
jgi:hypothetical protein